LLLGKSLPYSSNLIVPAVWSVRNVYFMLLEIVPAVYFFTPEFERGKHMKVGAVRESQFALAESNPALNHSAVIVIFWVGNQLVYSAHLHRYLPINGERAG
jgi:hypothetical protein